MIAFIIKISKYHPFSLLKFNFILKKKNSKTKTKTKQNLPYYIKVYYK